MGIVFLILFIGIPLLEIAVLIQVGDQIGLWSTIGLIILTAVIGTGMLRHQGIATLANAQKQLNQGAVPAKELFDGLCLLAAGALLLTPGFVTDSIGFALLIPPVRELMRNTLGKRISQGLQNSRFQSPRYQNQGFHAQGFSNHQQSGTSHEQSPFGKAGSWNKNDDTVIDGDYQDVTESDKDRLK
ncbi:FxsA family protein [Kiloniella sp. EL199]|uniref:FxsA family protein n=1 Tax=Kiloniella sp. EL199 TaxID=2107581 RepID=UPI000EA12027|nr:FxsA family protein [Kiloniella sp. EL199]